MAAVFTPTLSAPARRSLLTSSTVLTPPPTVRGTKTWSAVRRDDLEHRVASRRRRGNVEKRQLVCARLAIEAREFDRVPRVAKVLEVDALDYPARVDIQAGNDPHRDPHGR